MLLGQETCTLCGYKTIEQQDCDRATGAETSASPKGCSSAGGGTVDTSVRKVPAVSNAEDRHRDEPTTSTSGSRSTMTPSPVQQQPPMLTGGAEIARIRTPREEGLPEHEAMTSEELNPEDYTRADAPPADAMDGPHRSLPETGGARLDVAADGAWEAADGLWGAELEPGEVPQEDGRHSPITIADVGAIDYMDLPGLVDRLCHRLGAADSGRFRLLEHGALYGHF